MKKIILITMLCTMASACQQNHSIIIDKDYEMQCLTVVNNWLTDLMRCENQEAICYTAHKKIDCKFK